ncbi:MAG: RES family NAD+ phosphorylase [Cyclobacteriaceae bacterium]
MIVYRIVNPKYAEDLSGYGAMLNGARWNKRGHAMLYCAESSSLAILEFLVHIRGVKGNMSYKLLTLSLELDTTASLSNLSENWKDDIKHTQDVGTRWLQSNENWALRVPSVHNPLENNILLNPKHPDFSPKIMRSDWYWFDGRLIQKAKTD